MKREIILHLTPHRAAEMLLGCILTSVIVCALCISGFMPVESFQRELMMIAAPVVFLIWNFRLLRRCFVAFAGGRIYYIANISAYGIFALLNLCAYKFLPTDSYTWIFVITRLGRYSNLGITSSVAIAMFHCLMLSSIFAAPIGLGAAKIARKEELEFLKSVLDGFDENQPEQHNGNTEVAANEIKD